MFTKYLLFSLFIFYNFFSYFYVEQELDIFYLSMIADDHQYQTITISNRNDNNNNKKLEQMKKLVREKKSFILTSRNFLKLLTK